MNAGLKILSPALAEALVHIRVCPRKSAAKISAA
jgi:hypothetical protein